MKLAKVIGRVFCSRQCPSVDGRKLLLIQPLYWDDAQPWGDPLVATDCVGAGAGENVFYVQSREALHAFIGYDGETAGKDRLPPVDAAILGIVDGYQTDGKLLSGGADAGR